MSSSDDAAALRARRQALATGQPASHHSSGRPADLVVTSDMIPTPVTVSASGDLTPDEIHQLGACERAVENLATANWLAGKALQSIHERRLYRKSHGTFEEYVQERWEISVRSAYQMIEEWPLAERLDAALGRPATASHRRALLPIASRFGLDAAVDLYLQLGTRTKAEGLRLTAAIITQIVKAVLKAAGKEAEAAQFRETTRQLMSAGALPLAASSGSKPRAAPPSPKVQQPPTVPTVSLQNFADGNGEVSESRGIPSEGLADSTIDDGASDSNDAWEFFLNILAQAGAIDRALEASAYVGPFDFNSTSAREAIIRVLKRVIKHLQSPSFPPESSTSDG